MTYASHVAKIAKANNVKVVFVSDLDDCLGCITSRIVYILPVIDEKTYAIAMHELGHVLGSMQGYHKRDSFPLNERKGTFADAEIGAWIWAKENALYWLTSMQKTMKSCLDSYNENMMDKRLKRPAACAAYSKLF